MFNSAYIAPPSNKYADIPKIVERFLVLFNNGTTHLVEIKAYQHYSL